MELPKTQELLHFCILCELDWYVTHLLDFAVNVGNTFPFLTTGYQNVHESLDVKIKKIIINK